MIQAGPEATAVSIVIPHYGSPQLTTELVDALQLDPPQVSHEIIVIDDASPQPFPGLAGVRTERRTVNGGFGAAVNSGVELAVHPLVLVLNSDLTIDAGFVDALVRAAVSLQPAVIGPRLLNERGQKLVQRWNYLLSARGGRGAYARSEPIVEALEATA